MAITDMLKGGNPSAKFPTVGTTIGGTVVEAEPVQARNFDSGEPEVWDDGRPKMQIRVTVETDLRDPEDEHDDGKRGIYVKAWGDNFKALKAAIRAAGDDDVRPGGTFSATYYADGPKPKKGFAPKLFSYTYTKPSGAAALLKTPEAAPAPAAAPVAAPAPAPAPAAPAETDPAYAAFLAYQASQSA